MNILPPNSSSWEKFQNLPLPGWGAANSTLFDSCKQNLSDSSLPADFACASVAFDGTASSRSGAKYGPAAIRQASLVYSSQMKSRGNMELRNMRTGLVHKPNEVSIIDYGDLHVFPSNPQRQIEVTVAESFRIASRNHTSIFLGGEHTISIATYQGVAEAAKLRGQQIAYLQIDHHFDFGDQSILHGSYYHGSNARRISELSLLPQNGIGFFGVGDLTSNSQFHFLKNAGYKIISTYDLLAGNVHESLHLICKKLLSNADKLYVSIDIDVCDTSCAPGTGHVTIGGLSSRDFLAIAEVIKCYPVAALDIVEVSPCFDESGATANLAARFLFEYICLSKGEDHDN